MSHSSEEQANVTEIELKRWESEYYTRLEKEFFKLQSGAESNFTCPYCPGPSGHDYTLNEFLLHASIVSRRCSLTRSDYRNKAKHLALERYITTKYFDDDQLFVWPWMGILYITSASGETTVSQVKQELARKGFNPVRVQTFPNPEAQSVFAVVGFEESWDGFLCAMSFEKSFDAEHCGKSDSEKKLTCNDLGEQWYGWVARHADYNLRSTLGDYLRSHGGLTNVSDQRPPLNLQEMQRDCLDETIASLQKLKVESNGMAKAYDDEIRKMQQTMIELIEKMFLENGKATFLLDSHKEELEKELEHSECRKKYLEKKLVQCIHGKMHCEETLAQIKSPKKHQLQGKLEPMDPLRIKVQKKFEVIETQEKELQKSLRKIDPHMTELQIKLKQIKYVINWFHKNFELIESDKRKLQQKFEHSDELQRKLAHSEAQNQDLREKLKQIEPQKKEYQIMLELNKELQEKLEQTERQKNELLEQNEACKKELEEKLSESKAAKKERHIRFCMSSKKSERATLEHKKTLRFAKEKKILQRLNNKLHQKIIELESTLAKKEDELAYKDDLNQTLFVKERKRTDGLHDQPRIELVSMSTDYSFPQADESKAYLDGPIKFPAAGTDGVTEDDLMERFASSVSIVTSLASAISYPTLEATPYMFLSAYKNVLAIAVATDYSFPQADKFKAYLEEPIKFSAAATTGGVTEDDLMEKFASGVSIVPSLALSISYPTLQAAPYMFLNTYKNVLAIAVATDYSFPQADKVKEYLNGPIKFPAAATGGVSPAVAAKEEEKDEHVEDWMTTWILV